MCKSHLTLCHPMNCSLPGFTFHGIFQARILEWVAISYSRGSSQPRDLTQVSCFSCSGRWILYHWTTWEVYHKLSSVQFSYSVVSDSLRPHGLKHVRPPCPSPNPRVYLNSSPLNRWCHPTISSSVIHYSSRIQSFPASGSFQMNQFFISGGQSFGVSASAAVLPMNTQDWSPIGWTGWITLQSKWLSRVFSNTTVQKHQFFGAQRSSPPNSHIHTWLLEKR